MIVIAIFIQRQPVRVAVNSSNVRGPSSADPAVPAYPNAFVVLHGGQKTLYDDLAKAMSAATSGDTIEIRGDGPYQINVINVDRPLTIRAAAGSQPILVPADRRPAGPVLLQATAPLVLEGLEFQWTAADASRPRAILQSLASVSMANCRLVTTWKCDGLWSAGPIRIRNCEFLGRDPLRMTAISWRVASGECAVIDNCVMTGRIYLPFRDAELGFEDASIMLRHNTLVASTGIVLHLTVAPESLQLAPSRQKIRLVAVENAFDCRERVVVLNHSQSFQAADVAAVETYWRHCVDWQDQRNLCSSASVMMMLCRDMQPIALPKELPEWNRFWGITEAGNEQAAIRYQEGDPYVRLPTDRRPPDPRCFRLLVRPLHANGVDVDPGADLEWIGPGDAYERWKQTPHYQQWLKDSNHLE